MAQKRSGSSSSRSKTSARAKSSSSRSASTRKAAASKGGKARARQQKATKAADQDRADRSPRRAQRRRRGQDRRGAARRAAQEPDPPDGDGDDLARAHRGGARARPWTRAASPRATRSASRPGSVKRGAEADERRAQGPGEPARQGRSGIEDRASGARGRAVRRASPALAQADRVRRAAGVGRELPDHGLRRPDRRPDPDAA